MAATFKSQTATGKTVELTASVHPAYGPAPCYPKVIVSVPEINVRFSTQRYGVGGKLQDGTALPDGVSTDGAYVSLPVDAWRQAYAAAVEATNQKRAANGEPLIDVTDAVEQSIVQRPDLSARQAPTTNAPAEFECWECGYTTDNPSDIDARGMGCVRCNH